MSDNNFKHAFDESRNLILISGIALITIVTAFLLWTILRPSYEMLMQSPSEADLAKAVQELENQGVAYSLSEDGLNILVKKEDSSTARTALSELGLPYESTMGLELFATSDFGVTEFAQKVNYKRALEGELTRTVSSLSEVRYARVHLVLPEKRMFQKEDEEASAAVTLFLRDSAVLSAEQVRGVQDLVASSVPMVKPQRVVILDQNGITLNRKTKNAMGNNYYDSLKEKQSYESYIRQKIERILVAQYSETVFAVEVDVKLSTVTSKVIEKTILPFKGSKGALKSSNYTHNKSVTDKGDDIANTNEEKYDYGSRVEERVNTAGNDERITVAIFISKTLTEGESQKLKKLTIAIAGLKESRGDLVSIMALAEPSITPVQAVPEILGSSPSKLNGFKNLSEGMSVLLLSLFIAIIILLVFLVLLIKSKGRNNTPRMTSRQRDELLSKLNDWAETARK
ncbi:MAG: flagellar basal-body MS-ring/collar protein FliF [Cycloclasticus sp.]|jgi:flagellar basal-body M-ring protein/flagellar hook-basal body protein (fliF)